MNIVTLTGRLTKDPEIRYTQSGMCVAAFTIAVDRFTKEGKTADFPRITAFGKTAENMEKYCHKGMMLGVQGRIQTGSYEKDGKKVYTTDVMADRVEFLSKSEPDDGFSQIEGDVPW